jgi:hypothetical protein
MIGVPGGWAQWDQMIGTYRAEVNGVLIGTFTGEFLLLDTFESALTELGVTLVDQDREDLAHEKSLTE